MPEKESQSNFQEQQSEPDFIQEQYGLLKQCSEKHDMTEWNKWLGEHPDEKILLKGAPLENAYLAEAHLEHACLFEAHMENTNLWGAHLKKANLMKAHLEHAKLMEANLEHAHLALAHLEYANLSHVNLQYAKLMGANLKGAYFWEAKLQGADFSRAIVDGETLVSEECKVDRNTKFEAVGLDSMRIYPKTKQLLEYNIRQMNWEVWYGTHPKLKWLVKPFWLMSNYGMSTGRIAFAFFGLALVFANIYYHWARMAPPGVVENLFVDRNGVDVQWWLVPLRVLYFSIVTQTTLGFGDMYAKAQSIWGHILLSLQVILGYVLLGALVTRFAVLFTAGGPAGKLANEKKQNLCR